MKYIEINIDTSESGIEPVVAQLYEIGITDTVVEDPRDIEDLMEKKESYQWDYLDASVTAKLKSQPRVTVFMEEDEESENKVALIKEVIGDLSKKAKAGEFGSVDFGPLKITTKREDDKEWKDNWKEFFRPSKISKNFVVKPTWEEYTPKEGELVLEIDPGMAFGTGTHETTSLCVEMLEENVREGDFVLDVGCGSGILTIAAAMLKAEDVLGIDIDPVAIEVSKENIALNKVNAKVQYGDLTKGIEYRANVLVANLMADLIILFAPDAAKHIKPGGLFISSGILVEKKDVVSAAIMEAGFTILETREKGEWCSILARI